MASHMNLTFLSFLRNLMVLICLVMTKLLKKLLLMLLLLTILCRNLWRTTRMICIYRKENELDNIFLRQPAILKHNLPVEPLEILSQPKEDSVFDLKPLLDTLKYAYLDEKKIYPVIINATFHYLNKSDNWRHFADTVVLLATPLMIFRVLVHVFSNIL